MPDLIGQQLGQYQITGLLGTGGMAAVYRARQASMNRDVALKVIESEASKGGEFLKRFEREVQTVAGISHAHILKVFDYGQHDGMVYLVMELLTGGTLADIIGKGPMPLPQISRLMDQIASALDYAHRRGIVHRDLKPHNVMLDDDGNAFLTDFGIAKILSGAQAGTMTQAGAIMGTPAYMAPEQWRSEPVDARTDIYALGVMLYEMLTGRLPFEADTAFGYMHKHLNEPPPLREVLDRFPPGLENVLSRALAKNPAERFSSASDMVADFKEAIESRDEGSSEGDAPVVTLIEIPVEEAAPPPRASVAPTMPPKATGPLGGPPPGAAKAVPLATERRSPRTPLLIGAVGIVVVALAALLLSRGGGGGDPSSGTATAAAETQSQAAALAATATTATVTRAAASSTAVTPTPRAPSATLTTPTPTATVETPTMTTPMPTTMVATATRVTPTGVGAPMTRAAGTLNARETATAAIIASLTKTSTPTFTATLTLTATASPTRTRTATPSLTPTLTATSTFTASPTLLPCNVTAPTRTTSIFLGPSTLRTNLGYMPFDTPVMVLDQATDDEGNAWWRVDVPSNGAREVWVQQEDVEASDSCAVLFAGGGPVATPTPAPGEICTASAPTRTTSVYLGPSTLRTNLGYMPLNTRVPVLAQSTDAEGNDWWQVELRDRGGTETWVLQSSVSTSGPCAGVPVRTATPES